MAAAGSFPTVAGVYAASGTAAGRMYTTKLLQGTQQAWMPKLRFAALNQTPALKAFGLMAFGKDDLLNTGAAMYGNAQSKRGSNGRGVVFTDPSFQFSGPLVTAYASGTHVGRLGNINPEYLDGQDAWAYPYKRLVWSIQIPEEEVKDNKGTNRLSSLLERDLKLAKAGAIRDLNNILLGSSSAPANSPFGLPKLISYTQDVNYNAGGITPSDSNGWSNQFSTCTSVGGGGEVDRPLTLLRKMEAALLDLSSLPGSSITDMLMIGTRGAYQYYMRAAYGDTVAQGLRNKEFYDAGIDHLAFHGRPFIYDGAVTVPGGADTGTEAIYFVNTTELGMAIRKDEFLDIDGWAAPQTHHNQRYFQCNIFLRYTPFVSHRRVQSVLANIPNNVDADTTVY